MVNKLPVTVKRCLTRYRFFSFQAPLVVAVSTGVDSMVLLHILQTLLPTDSIVVAHVNHHLRQQSEKEERYIRRYCKQHHLRIFVDEWISHPKVGIEDAARQERYRFFKMVMHQTQSHFLLTAHHENDLAETILMKLIRSGKPDEVVGIEENRRFNGGQLLRPFLSVSKEQLVDYARTNGIRWFEDSTNHDDDTLRNRFRHHYLPELARENPELLDHLYKFHEEMDQLLNLKSRVMQTIYPQVIDNNDLIIDQYKQHNNYLRYQLLQNWFNNNGLFNINDQHLKQLDHLILNPQIPSKQLEVHKNYLINKNYQKVNIKKVQNSRLKVINRQQIMVKFDRWYADNFGRKFGVFTHPKKQVVAEMWLTPNQLPLSIRGWHSNDQLRLKSGDHQSIRRVMINQKIPLAQRPNYLVLVDNQSNVLWAIGLKTSWLDRQAICGSKINQLYFCQDLDTGENDE